MAPWKVLLAGLLGCACLSLSLATLLVPMVVTGGERWAWLGGLLSATAVAVAGYAAFLRSASAALDAKVRRADAGAGRCEPERATSGRPLVVWSRARGEPRLCR